MVAEAKEKAMGEFKSFIARGNVLDLAVAVIIGAAFATIVASLTGDLIMPAVGVVFGNVDFSSHYILLGPVPEGYSGPMTYAALKAAGVPMLGYGQFLTALVNFLILAFAIFLLVKAATRAMARKAEQSDVPDNMLSLLTEIRDELRRRP
jgi:large conductance mechanosensitive channel